MIPSYSELELPLLHALDIKGGKARPSEIYERLQHSLGLSDADLSETLASGDNKFRNRVRWVRQLLIDKGEMYRADYGVWGITEKGRARLRGKTPAPDAGPSLGGQPQPPASPAPSQPATSATSVRLVNFEEIAEDYAAAFERKVLQELLDREPKEFEEFAVKLLTAYGFRKMKVTRTQTAPDGGIDGNGELRVGLVAMRAAFQCKRWQGVVGRPEIDKFRGAIQGRFEHGYFFTTVDLFE